MNKFDVTLSIILNITIVGEKGKSVPTDDQGASTDDPDGASRRSKAQDDEYLGFIIGALATLILLLFVLIAVIIIRQRKHKLNNNHQVTME